MTKTTQYVPGLTSFALKMIGIILMVSDHIHEMFSYMGAPMWLTMLGRVVAPIFLFLAAEGFHYTSNRKRYATQLLIGYWITNAVKIALEQWLPNPNIVLINSIFGTLFMAVIAMWIYEGLKHPKKNPTAFVWAWVGIAYMIGSAAAVPVLLTHADGIGMTIFQLFMFFVPNFVTVEGGVLFILIALIFYIFRERRWIGLTIFTLISLAFMWMSYQQNWADIQWLMIFAVPLLAAYNGREGRKDKWFFYTFYPTHIAVLYIIATVFFK